MDIVTGEKMKVAKLTVGQLDKIKAGGLVRKNSKGLTAKVYKLNETECVKVFNSYRDEYELTRYNMFANLDFSCAIMPKLLYLLNWKFKAFKMDLVSGPDLGEVDKNNFEYSKFIFLANELINGVLDEISEEGIKIYDCHFCNIMYDYSKDKLFLIDPGDWTNNIYNPEATRLENFDLINRAIFSFLFRGIKLVKTIQYGDDIIDYYETRREMIEKRSGTKIKMLSDLEKL